MTTVSDNFNRADGALGANWASGLNSANQTIVSNAVVGNADSSDHISIWQGTALGPLQVVDVKVVTASASNQYVRAGCNSSGAAGTYQGYGAYTDTTTGAGHTEVDEWIGGAQTVIGNVAATFIAGTDTIGIQRTGSGAGTRVQMRKNGVAIGAVFTPANIFAAGQPAMGTFHTASLDNFNADDGVATSSLPLLGKRLWINP